jgi:ABC-2 type transport system permease protein
MAVYERRLRPWAGPLTSRRWRFLVVARYARREVFRSRIATAFFAVCLAPVLGAALYVYLIHNLDLLQSLGATTDRVPAVDELFFSYGLRCQGLLAFLFAVLVGPGLIAPDLADNALPLYLSRPISRGEYVLGKLTVLGAALSAVTWVPLVLLALLDASLTEGPPAADHLRIVGAVFAGSLLWILLVALLTLALSAWVRWKTLAAALLVAVFFVARALGALINATFGTVWGDVVNPSKLIVSVWDQLLFGTAVRDAVPAAAAWTALAAAVALCLVLLHRKLRAYEVVR